MVPIILNLLRNEIWNFSLTFDFWHSCELKGLINLGVGRDDADKSFFTGELNYLPCGSKVYML